MERARILIIEDEKPLARLLELALAHEGYTVQKEYDGAAGLRRVPQFEPDLTRGRISGLAR